MTVPFKGIILTSNGIRQSWVIALAKLWPKICVAGCETPGDNAIACY